MRTLLATFAVAAVLCPPAARASEPLARASEPRDKAENPVAVDDLRKGLMAALGDDFEYLGGELGRTTATVGFWKGERFWFAHVRPKTAGQFALSHTITFDFPDELKKPRPGPDRAVYLLPIKIGERGAPRVIRPGEWGGSAYPHANVGDTLVFPIHVDRYRSGNTFATPTTENRYVRSFFHVANELEHEQFMKQAAAKPVVRNQAADRLDLLASWGKSYANRASGRAGVHRLTAYLEFKQPGEFNLAGRLADADLADADEEAAGDGVAVRVAPKDKPVTMLLEHFDYQEHTGKATASGSGKVDGGTIEVRVGDRVVIDCGKYPIPGVGNTEVHRQGVVLVRPFKAIEPYTPEPKK